MNTKDKRPLEAMPRAEGCGRYRSGKRDIDAHKTHENFGFTEGMKLGRYFRYEKKMIMIACSTRISGGIDPQVFNNSDVINDVAQTMIPESASRQI